MRPRNLFPGTNLTGNLSLNKLFALIALFLLPLVAAPLVAQQGYPNYPQPYGYGYGSQNQPPPPSGYAPPQYAQPQYPQPEYSQPSPAEPQYPQYAQPQYGSQYGAQPYAQPTQPYAAQPYGQPPAPDEAYAQPGQPYDYNTGPNAEPAPQQPPLSPDQLEQLLAPIALYPDNLLAQILTASTYPAQVAVADQWVHQMQSQGYGSPDQIAAGADSENWDPSVKALTAFPQVLDTLNQNLQWTTALGDAYYNQPQDVMQTVQVLRQRAEGAGNLQSTPQESVTQDQGALEIAPPNPQYIYVPVYDPWTVYGAPIAPYSGFSFAGALGDFFGASPIRYGLGFAMSAFLHTPYGWLGWGLDWLAHSVLFDHSAYFTHSTTVADWGFPHGGPRAFGGGWSRGGRWAGYGDNRPVGMPRPEMRAGQSWAGREPYAPRYGETARPGEYGRPNEYGRSGYPSRTYNYDRLPQQAYNRPAPEFPRPQSFAGGTYGRYGYGYGTRPAESYAARGRTYASPYGSYRAPQQTYQRSFAEPRGFDGFRSSSNGFGHGFGRGYDGYGGKAPKGFSGGHSFFGGGHSSGGFRAPRGGGHFGGGRHGGHSGGGHGHHR